MYRIPILDLLTIFLPIWFLGLISLCVYFLSNDLGSRLKIVTTVMLSFIAYKPLVRKLLPPNPKITFIEIIIYTLLFISFLLLLSSFINDQLESEFVWNKDGFFIISLIIQIATTLSIIILIVGYYLYWKPSYNIQPGVKILLKLDQWKN